MQSTTKEFRDDHSFDYDYSMLSFENDLEMWPQIGGAWSFGVSVCTDDFMNESRAHKEISLQARTIALKRHDSSCMDNMVPGGDQHREHLNPSTALSPVFLAPPIKPEFQFIHQEYQIVNADQVVPVLEKKAMPIKEGAMTLICTHCNTEATSLWRRIMDKLMCNACALYFKLHGVMRPLHLNTGVIKRRNRLGSTVKRLRRYKC